MKKCKYCGKTDINKLCKDKRESEGVINVCYACKHKKAKETDPNYMQKKLDWKKTEKGRLATKRHNHTESHRVILRDVKAKRRVREGMIMGSEIDQMKWFYSAAKKISMLRGKQYDVDHVYPLSKGGDHSLDNVQLLEHGLNTIKNDKLDTGITGCKYYALKNALSHVGEI